MLWMKYGALAAVFSAVFLIVVHWDSRRLRLSAVQGLRLLNFGKKLSLSNLAAWPPRGRILLTWVSGLGFGIVGFWISRGRGISLGTLVVSLATAGLGFFLPRILLGWQQQQRLRTLDQALPNGLELLANALRAGLSLAQALEMVAKESSPLLAAEFRDVVRNIRLGLPASDALEKMLSHWPHPDLELFVIAAGISQRTGGNLPELVGRILETIRERNQLQGKIQTLTSQGRLSGWVVGLLPLFLMLVLTYLDPELMRGFIHHPLGWVILTAGLGMELIGAWFIRKIVAIDI